MWHYISCFNPPWHNETNVYNALTLHGCDVHCYEVTNQHDRPGTRGRPAIKPGDIVFTATPHRILLSELRTYKNQGAKLVTWYWDWLWSLQNREAAYLPRLLLMDAVFSTDGSSSAEYIRRGVQCRQYLPQCAAPEPRLRLPPSGTKKHDVIFVGSLWTPDRKELARRLSLRWDFANVGAGPRVWGRPLSNACQSSSICIGTNFRNDEPGYWSDRCYVVMGAGGFYLGQYVQELEQTFTGRVHCGFFDGLKDMEEQVEWWLAHPAEREACRLRGHALVQEQHTYTNRVTVLLAKLRSLGILGGRAMNHSERTRSG